MGQRFKVEELVSAAELEELEAFAREPGRTIDELKEWLEARGFVISRGAVHNWKQHFDELRLRERFTRSSDLARSMQQAISSGDVETVAKGAIKQLTQVVFEQSLQLEQDGQVDAQDVQRWSAALKNLLSSNRDVKEQIALAVAAAEAQVKDGATGEKVLETIKKAFGI